MDTVTDPDNRQTKTVYDLIGQTTCSWKGWQGSFPAPASAGNPCGWTPSNYPGSTGEALRYAAYEYSPNGKQTSVTDANNNETLFTFDGHDRALRTTFPDATYEEFTYYDGGQLCSGDSQPCEKRLRNGGTLAYTYDALNRMASKDPSDAELVTFGYNLVGDPNYIYETAGLLNSPSAHYSYRNYDGAGRQLVETSELGNISYQYDQAGNRKRTTWPDGYYVTYAYDAANRMTAVTEKGTTQLASYQYDSLSRRELLTLGGVAQHKVVYQYTVNDRLEHLNHHLGSTTAAFTFDYGYNDSGQLTSLASSDTFYLGKRRTSETYTVNNLNQYETVGSATLNYDPNGNLTQWDSPEYGVQRYSYDIENRLQTIAVNGSTTPTHYYDYDGLGRRVYKRTDATLGAGGIFTGGTETFYLLDGDEEIAEYDQNGTVLRRYVTGPAIDDRIAMIEGSSTSPSISDRHYYHTNHQGSVVTTALGSGTLIDEYGYDEYGNLTDDSRATTEGQPFRYTGRRYDEETGLYYYRARYYSPELGRFLSTDPIGYGDDINLYAYVKNDPLNLNDPHGKVGIVAAIAIGYAAFEALSTIYDVYDAGSTVADNDASTTDKAVAVGGLVAGSVLPGPGSIYKKAAKKGLENTGKLTQRAATRQAKREAGIPTSQQASSQTSKRASDGTKVGRQQNFDVAKPGGGTQKKSVQVSRDQVGAHAGKPQVEAGNVKSAGQTDSAGRPRIENEGKVRVDFDPFL